MKIIGIVGRSGTGKSYISAFFKEKGALVIDGDKIAHSLMKEGPLVNELADAFGKDILCENGIDRRKLGKIVFSDPTKLETLNKISHAHICREFDRLIAESDAPFAVIDAAALIESEYKCDILVAVLSDDKTCAERIVNRDNISREDALSRLSAQKKDDFYTQNADFVIVNDGRDITPVLKEIYEKAI